MRSTPMFTVVLALSTPALAKTPDGRPPSVETVCDEYRGAAFGLCNAYCEAMDCDHPDVHASSRACAQVSSKFERLTGEKLVCDPGGGEEECVVTAVDDVDGERFVVNWTPVEPYPPLDEGNEVLLLPSDGGGVLLDVRRNDQVTPPDAKVTIIGTSLSGDAYALDEDGQGVWAYGPGNFDTFTYEVCCDESESCDVGFSMVTCN